MPEKASAETIDDTVNQVAALQALLLSERAAREASERATITERAAREASERATAAERAAHEAYRWLFRIVEAGERFSTRIWQG